MGRVLVKSSLPGKVLVKSNYAFDAFGNPVLLSTPSTREGAPVRGERLAGILGGAAGAGLALTQPANSLAQLINNLRYGMFEGARDARGLRRGLSSRRERIRANRAADLANQYAALRAQEPIDQRRQRGLFDRITGGNFMTAGQQEQALYEADVQRRLADERAARNAALGQEIAEMVAHQQNVMPDDLSLPEMQGGLQKLRNLAAVGARGGNYIPAFVPPAPTLPVIQPPPTPSVQLPPPTPAQNAQLLRELQAAVAQSPVGPAQGAARRAMNEVLAAGGSNADASAAMREAIMQSMNQPPESAEEPIVNAAGENIGVVGSGQAVSAMNAIPSPQQGALSAAKEEETGTPAPNAMVPTTAKEPTEQGQEEDKEKTDIEGDIKAAFEKRFGSGAEA
tara:strand:- start:10 stop:1194 length:1185 start_codon:yes stop_codon:yes gene_type:complete